MNDDLISRKWLKTAIHNFYYGLKHTPTEKDIQAYIDVAPSVNPQKPKTIQEKQAEAEKYQKAFEDGYEKGYAQARFDYEQEPKTGHWRHYEGMLICSKCGTEFYDDIMEYCGDDVPKYCPNCGARMESEG